MRKSLDTTKGQGYNSQAERKHASLAQLDRASGYGPEGRGFEFSMAHQILPISLMKVGNIFLLFFIKVQQKDNKSATS